MAATIPLPSNGNARIAFYNSLDGVTFDLAAGTLPRTASGDVASGRVKILYRCDAVRGFSFADVISRDAGNTLGGQAGKCDSGMGGAEHLIGGVAPSHFVFAAISTPILYRCKS